MEDFLLKESAGVIKMHVLDFNEELHNQSLREEGYEAGLEAGLEKGREEGLEKGLEKGREEGQSSVILSMLKIGRTPKEISDFCNIPLEQITKIQSAQNV